MTTDFIAELVRAANEIEKLGPREVSGLLTRAIVVIRDLREALGIPGTGTRNDQIIGLFNASADVDVLDVQGRAAALLKAAEMVRTLHIASDGGTRIWIRVQDPLD